MVSSNCYLYVHTFHRIMLLMCTRGRVADTPNKCDSHSVSSSSSMQRRRGHAATLTVHQKYLFTMLSPLHKVTALTRHYTTLCAGVHAALFQRESGQVLCEFLIIRNHIHMHANTHLLSPSALRKPARGASRSWASYMYSVAHGSLSQTMVTMTMCSNLITYKHIWICASVDMIHWDTLEF